MTDIVDWDDIGSICRRFAFEQFALKKPGRNFWEEAAIEIDLLRHALTRIAEIENQEFGSDWEEIDMARDVARKALKLPK